MFLLSFITLSRSDHWIILIFHRLELLLRRCPSFVIKNLYQPLFRIWIQPSGSTFGFSLRVQPSGSAFGLNLWARENTMHVESENGDFHGVLCKCEYSGFLTQSKVRANDAIWNVRNISWFGNQNVYQKRETRKTHSSIIFWERKKRAFVITFISKGECLRVHSNRDSEKWHRKGHKNIGPLEECERGALQKNLKKWHRKVKRICVH